MAAQPACLPNVRVRRLGLGSSSPFIFVWVARAATADAGQHHVQSVLFLSGLVLLVVAIVGACAARLLKFAAGPHSDRVCVTACE